MSRVLVESPSKDLYKAQTQQTRYYCLGSRGEALHDHRSLMPTRHQYYFERKRKRNNIWPSDPQSPTYAQRIYFHVRTDSDWSDWLCQQSLTWTFGANRILRATNTIYNPKASSIVGERNSKDHENVLEVQDVNLVLC